MIWSSALGRKPLVGIMCCNERWDRAVQTVATRFIDPLARLSEVSPVLVPAVSDVADLDSIAAALDGLLLTGSRSNVAPERYGAPSSDQPTDPDRDEVALRLSARMIDSGKPVFGICRGLQELNVLFGGSLRDLEGDRHHAKQIPGENYESLFQHRHDVRLSTNSLWTALAGPSASVSSAHRQAIDRLGNGLKIEARSDDGVIEAFTAPGAGAPVLAVQWHPEIDADASPLSSGFYAAFRNALYERSESLLQLTG